MSSPGLTDEQRLKRRRSNLIALAIIAAALLLIYGCTFQVQVDVKPTTTTSR